MKCYVETFTQCKIAVLIKKKSIFNQTNIIDANQYYTSVMEHLKENYTRITEMHLLTSYIGIQTEILEQPLFLTQRQFRESKAENKKFSLDSRFLKNSYWAKQNSNFVLEVVSSSYFLLRCHILFSRNIFIIGPNAQKQHLKTVKTVYRNSLKLFLRKILYIYKMTLKAIFNEPILS